MKQYIGISESNLYGNWKVFSPENILMFRCGNSKAKFYLKKNLAIQLDDTSIQLTFEPKGLGHHEEIYGLQNMYNQCVCCGSTENLTKHHIIPYCYRHYFPTSLKEHTSHDVVMLCGKHHKRYEKHAYSLKKRLSEQYNVPLQGYNSLNENDIKIRKRISAYLYRDLPPDVYSNYESEIKEYTQGDLSEENLEYILSIKNVAIKTHGEAVVEQLKTTEELLEFEKMWRRHFIENVGCNFLPEGWSIDYIRRERKQWTK